MTPFLVGCRRRSLKARSVEVLPCRYFHLIATVPSELRSLFLRHQKTLYGLLIKTAAECVRDLAAEKRFVGAQVGILAVLHTWTGQLHHHPHVHMLVTGGGVTADGAAWHDAPKDFLVPVRKLSPMIAKRFATALKKDHPKLFEQIPDTLWHREWCSYCKPYGKGQDAVLKYLARYVFRVALTNRRLIAMDDTHVTFQSKDHKTGQWRTVRLEGIQFLRRFLFHVLPKGFHKVRYYGLWHPSKRDLQARARLLLELTTVSAGQSPLVFIADMADEALEQSGLGSQDQVIQCPKCGSTNLCRINTACRRHPMLIK
ncbi:transposase [Planctomycetota bacterium]